MVVVYVGSKRNKVNKYWFHDGYMIFIYCLVIFFFFLDSKYERGDNKKYLSNDRVHGNIGFFKWLVMKVGKKESSYR